MFLPVCFTFCPLIMPLFPEGVTGWDEFLWTRDQALLQFLSAQGYQAGQTGESQQRLCAAGCTAETKGSSEQFAATQKAAELAGNENLPQRWVKKKLIWSLSLLSLNYSGFSTLNSSLVSFLWIVFPVSLYKHQHKTFPLKCIFSLLCPRVKLIFWVCSCYHNVNGILTHFALSWRMTK